MESCPISVLRQLSLAVLLLLVSGCFPARYPTQNKPVCSWSSQPPDNADALCSTVFRTLRTVVRAQVTGDDRTVRRLVTSRRVSGRIIAFGRILRANGARGVHIVPSITLAVVSLGRIGAGFYVLGKDRHGRIKKPETVYLRVREGRAVIVGDQPRQEW